MTISRADIKDFLKTADFAGGLAVKPTHGDSITFAASAIRQLLAENKKLKHDLAFSIKSNEISKQVNQTALADAKHHKRAGIAVARKLHDEHWCVCQLDQEPCDVPEKTYQHYLEVTKQ